MNTYILSQLYYVDHSVGNTKIAYATVLERPIIYTHFVSFRIKAIKKNYNFQKCAELLLYKDGWKRIRTIC